MARPDVIGPHARVLTLAGVALVLAVLYVMQEVLLPIALAVLLTCGTPRWTPPDCGSGSRAPGPTWSRPR